MDKINRLVDNLQPLDKEPAAPAGEAYDNNSAETPL